MKTDAATAHAIGPDAIRAEAESMLTPIRLGKREHAKVFQEILENLITLDFRELADLAEDEKLTQKHFRVLTVQEVLQNALDLNCGLCRNLDFVYAYNGEYWQLITRDELENFLGEASEKLGVDRITAKDYEFKAKLYKQFLADAYLPKPQINGGTVLINLRNGTFQIAGKQIILREFDRADFLTHQLSFDYDESAACPNWQAFLDEVLPEKDGAGKIVDKGKTRQKILAEYFGYVFARVLKLEKTLILFGLGANGKSVVFDIMNALLGKDNVSNYSLEALGENYFRAMIANTLLNYSSEISNRLQAEKFKQLTSGEAVEARLPYGQPMVLTNYARLAFNCNSLPSDVEHTEAFFRRFLIVPFDVTIPEEKRNPNLAKQIIENELSGVFNWILDGLKRVLANNRFSKCDAAENALGVYRKESDSVAMFISDEGYRQSEHYTQVKTLYQN
ncbi:MAG: DNA primase, partial [Blastocatellia bacterium]|nr:DNA primase [Blastocatellia bacterium]